MTETAPFVAIAVPSGDMVHADFAMRLATLCLNPGARACIINAKSSLVMIGRNQCVEAARLVKATHLLFLDSDIVFPVDTLTRLLAHGKDIVGGLYVQRTPPHHSLGMTYEGKHELVTEGLKRMKIMPTGCLLLRLALFDKLTKPWFNTQSVGEKIMGEDYYFCERASAAGFEIWCDGDLSRELAHLGQKAYTCTAQSS
jgi:hypothetical protein